MKKKNLSMQRFAIFVTVFFLILIGISSCASRRTARETTFYVYLTNNSKFFLLPPEAIEKPMDMIQHISASFRRQNHFFNAWVIADETKIEMSIFNEMGATMGELFFREGFIDFKSPIFPRAFRPEYIVADFQLSFYDPHFLRLALEKSGLFLEIEGNNRRIYEKNELIVEIIKNDNSVTLINHLRGYTYTMVGDFE